MLVSHESLNSLSWNSYISNSLPLINFFHRISILFSGARLGSSLIGLLR